MRRAIGWVDKNWQGGKREVRVNISSDAARWQFWNEETGDWDCSSQAPREYWEILEQKLLELKQRGHLFDREIAVVRKQLSQMD